METTVVTEDDAYTQDLSSPADTTMEDGAPAARSEEDSVEVSADSEEVLSGAAEPAEAGNLSEISNDP